MDSDELKPCPFCGGKASLEVVEIGYREYFEATCLECSASTRLGSVAQQVVQLWNRREAEEGDRG